MKPHEERVVKERDELEEKLAGLDAFIQGPHFKTLEDEPARLLALQGYYMQKYQIVLDARIALFKP